MAPVGTVTYMSVWQAARAARRRVEATRLHPALRYGVGDGYGHARGPGGAVCGAAGTPLITDRPVPDCPECFPA